MTASSEKRRGRIHPNAVQIMRRYGAVLVLWRCNARFCVVQWNSPFGFPSESNANIRFFSGKAKQNRIIF